MADYDIVVVGGGHSGLTAAAYFCKAGLKTAVLEKNDFVGGGAITQEVIMKGVYHDLHSIVHYGALLANPMIAKDELGLLSQYGYKYIVPEIIWGVPFKDKTSLVWTKSTEQTAKSIGKVSKQDETNYLKFVERMRPVVNSSLQSMYEPLPSFSEYIAELESTSEGREVLQLSYMSAVDMAEEWFDDDRMKAAFIRLASEFAGVSPTHPGTAMAGVKPLISIHLTGWGAPVGGSGRLSEATEACIKAHGGTVITGAMVTRILVKDGRAVGAKTSDGRKFAAKKGVVCDLNILQIPRMVGEDNLGSDYVKGIRRLTFSQGEFVSHWVTTEYPKYSANESLNRAYGLVTAPSSEDVIQAFERSRKGEPVIEMPWVACPTVVDPSRAPAGKHTLYMITIPVPYSLRDGGPGAWAKVKDDLAWRQLDFIREYAPNMTRDKVVGMYSDSPVDQEKRNPSFIRGDARHFAPTIGQVGPLRPLPGYNNINTPVKDLFLCGPSADGVGGGVFGQSRAAAKVIMGYLNVDFNKAIQPR